MKGCRFVLAIGCLVGVAGQAQAVIIHPSDDALTISGPSPTVVGRWDGSGSCVAIGPNHIITTRHQGGGVGSVVVFSGQSYVVAAETVIGSADVRVCRIQLASGMPANLPATGYVSVFTGDDSLIQDFTITGYGRGRGAALTTTGGTYGYLWNSDGNTTSRSGRNKIDGQATITVSGFTSNALSADFDRPASATAVPGEAMSTEFDSGSGWFVENGTGNWQVRALTDAVDHVGTNDALAIDRALFASNANALTDEPDVMYGVRLATYSSQIAAAVPEPTAFALVAPLAGLLLARRRRMRQADLRSRR